jgi:isoquinoline 1-oxidoreductase
VTYAALAKGKAIERHLEGEPKLKAVSEFTVVGREVLCRDSHAKVTGQAQYTGDIRVEGMVYARVLRPAAHGASLRSLDSSGVEQITGAQVIRDGELVAVLHEQPDEAEKALRQLQADYDLPEARFDDESVFQYFIDHAADGEVVQQEGTIQEGQGLAKVLVKETYRDGYVSHAPIETHTALAQFEGDHLTVWASTQTPFGLRGQIAQALGWPTDRVRVIAPFVGGGFGGKISNGQALQAVRLYVPTCGGDRDSIGSGGVRADGDVGLRCLRGWQKGCQPVLQRAARSNDGLSETCRRRADASTADGALAGTGQQHEQFRQRVTHGRHGR